MCHAEFIFSLIQQIFFVWKNSKQIQLEKCIIKNVIKTLTLKGICGEFPGGLVVRILGFHCWGPGSTFSRGTEIPQAVQRDKKKKKKTFVLACSLQHYLQ